MRELLDSFLENGLADFEGLQISGTIPVKTDLINAVIADFLKPAGGTTDVAAVAADKSLEIPVEAPPTAPTLVAAPARKKVSLQGVIRPLIKHVGVRAIEGKIVVEFDISR